MKRDKLNFIIVNILLMMLLSLISFIGFYISLSSGMNLMRFFIIFISLIIGCIVLFFIWNIIILIKLVKSREISKLNYKIFKRFLSFFYPLLINVSKLLQLDIDSIRRVFTKINNLMILAKDIKVRSNEILILLPHCLQYSKCQYKITNNIENCRLCGKCNIKDILNLCKEYNVKCVVATGGTLARAWIKKYKPKAIIAVACERDLTSGINDVKVLPVLGVVNERPKGPCFNTRVNIDKLEEAIKFFLEED
ncbi:MAG: DUF116 domain-containing protein [Firmicutes bacterium]|nr:DUF116 domain-containing protein [Bacillota bacterium]